MKKNDKFLNFFKFAPAITIITAINFAVIFFAGNLNYFWQAGIISLAILFNIFAFIKYRDTMKDSFARHCFIILCVIDVVIYGYCARYSAFNFNSFDIFMTIAAVAGIIYCYFYKNYFMLFLCLVMFSNSIISLYIDFFELNIYYITADGAFAFSVMPLFMYFFLMAAFIHSYFKNSYLCYCYLLNYLIIQTFYCLIIKFDFNLISGILSFIGFLSVFIIYFYNQSHINNLQPGVEINSKFLAASKNNTVMIWLGAFLIFTLFLNSLFFYFQKNSSDVVYTDIFAQGASLYYDAFMGYMVKFKLPFETVALEINDSDLKKLKQNKYFKFFIKKEISLKGILNDIEVLPDGRKIACIDAECSTLVIDKTMIDKISPRFIYKLKIGICKNGESFIHSYSLAGDKFLIFDDENNYNKYKNPVKNFLALSNNSAYSAIYDFSGNVRIINNNNAKIKLIVNDLAGMKSVLPYGADNFVLLTKDKLILILTELIEIKSYKLPDSIKEKDDISIAADSGSAKILISQSGIPSFIFQIAAGYSAVKINSQCDSFEVIYLKDALLFGRNFLSSSLTGAVLGNNSNLCELTNIAALNNVENFLSAVSNPINIQIGKVKNQALIYYGYSQKEKIISRLFILYDLINGKLSFTKKASDIKLDFEPSIITSGDYNAGLFILNGTEKAVINYKNGFFYDEYKKLNIIDSEENNFYTQPLPAGMISSEGVLYLLFENTYYIIDAATLKIIRKFEACR